MELNVKTSTASQIALRDKLWY